MTGVNYKGYIMINIKRESKIELWRWIYIVPSLILLVITTTKRIRKEWFKKILLSYYGSIDGGLRIKWTKKENTGNGKELLGQCAWQAGYLYVSDDLPLSTIAEVFFHEARHAYQYNSWRVVNMGRAAREYKKSIANCGVFLPEAIAAERKFELYLKLPYL